MSIHICDNDSNFLSYIKIIILYLKKLFVWKELVFHSCSIRNISKRYRHKDTQYVAFLEQRKEARMCPVKDLTPTGTKISMRTKPFKNIYVS
jgi:hypothetical protein